MLRRKEGKVAFRDRSKGENEKRKEGRVHSTKKKIAWTEPKNKKKFVLSVKRCEKQVFAVISKRKKKLNKLELIAVRGAKKNNVVCFALEKCRRSKNRTDLLLS